MSSRIFRTLAILAIFILFSVYAKEAHAVWGDQASCEPARAALSEAAAGQSIISYPGCDIYDWDERQGYTADLGYEPGGDKSVWLTVYWWPVDSDALEWWNYKQPTDYYDFSDPDHPNGEVLNYRQSVSFQGYPATEEVMGYQSNVATGAARCYLWWRVGRFVFKVQAEYFDSAPEAKSHAWAIAGKLHQAAENQGLLEAFPEVRVVTDQSNYPPPSEGSTTEVYITVEVRKEGLLTDGAQVWGQIADPEENKFSFNTSDFESKGNGKYTAVFCIDHSFVHGEYDILIMAAKGDWEKQGQASFTLKEIVKVQTDQEVYPVPAAGGQHVVAVTVTVAEDGDPVVGAAVSAEIQQPDGGEPAQLDVADFNEVENGVYTASYTLTDASSEGYYNIEASVSKDGLESKGYGRFFLGTAPKVWGFVTDGHYNETGDPNKLQPIREAPVTLTWKDGDEETMLGPVYTDSDGVFAFQNPDIPLDPEIDFFLSVTLVDKDKTFRIVDKSVDIENTVFAETYLFSLAPDGDYVKNYDEATREVELVNIDLSNTTLFELPKEGSVALAHMEHVAAIYFHTQEAASFGKNVLGMTYDLGTPVDIRTYALSGEEADDADWRGPDTVSVHELQIYFGNNVSPYSSEDRPHNREWHEFGHHVMADAFSNEMPAVAFEINHGGFDNNTTTDSWAEGFAEFYSLMVGKSLGKTDWRIYGGTSIEDNIQVWEGKDEELAIAGILVDLLDGVNYKESADSPEEASDHDNIQLTETQIWNVLKAKVPGSDRGNGHVFDLKDLYDVFSAQAVRGEKQNLGYTQEDLDAIFIAHGAFHDKNKNRTHEEGETVGIAADEPETKRRRRPLRGGYVQFTAREADTGAPVEIDEFTVRVEYDEPFGFYSYEYKTRPVDDDKVYLELSPTDRSRTAHVTAHSAGHYPSDELEVSSDTYFDAVQSFSDDQPGVIASHAFELAPAESPDFQVVVAPSILTAHTGETWYPVVQIRSLGGFDGQVLLGLENLPAGVSAQFEENTLAPGQFTRTVLAVGENVTPGTYEFTVRGESEGIVRTSTVRLTVPGGTSQTPPSSFEGFYGFDDEGAAEDWIDDGSGLWSIQDGVYNMTGNKGNMLRFSRYSDTLSDFAIQADVRKNQGDPEDMLYGCGFQLRSDEGLANMYDFNVIYDGRFMVGRYVEGEYTQLVPWKVSKALKTGYGQWNTLKASARGNVLKFYANGVLLATVRDDSISSGRVALYAVDAASSTVADDVDFDNVIVVPTPVARLFYPHVASGNSWETEIAAINPLSDQSISGVFRAYDNSGGEVSQAVAAVLGPNARRSLVVGQDFSSPEQIGYVVFEADRWGAVGYTKFFVSGKYRVAVPAVAEVNTGDVHISHVASSGPWATGVSLVNTLESDATIAIEFGDGSTKTRTIPAGAHDVFLVRELFDGQTQPGIGSAVVKNATGIAGLELFSSGNQLSGISLKDQLTNEIFYPHLASVGGWATGVVAFNPASSACDIAITAYDANGRELSVANDQIAAGGKYVGAISNLIRDPEAAWFKIDADLPVTGFELFANGDQLAGYTGVAIDSETGIFPKIDHEGSTGIALVNLDTEQAHVALTAYDDDGVAVAFKEMELAGGQKYVKAASAIFSRDISAATYVKYESDRRCVGFQLNGGPEGMMLDALPGLFQ